MPLAAGSRLGPYEIVAPLGAGGMGEVYRARDRRLNRDVAIKVLPDSFAADPDRLARFQREAQVLASLSHPNIGHIYGIEDMPSKDAAQGATTHALVLELIAGPTLADHMAQGPLPLAEAVAIARQIADALDAAHEQGVVHRDLKPANIKVTDDGTVKVLDFGLAKALSPEGARATSDAMNSPTFMSPAKTQMGLILGTAAYMAPEQAKGKPVDKRADIWAFGVVLFEMLAGRPLFQGDSVVETIGFVATRDPDWTMLPASTPANMRRLLARCLTRDPKDRLRDIGEARIALAARDEPATAPELTSQPRPRRAWAAAAALAVLLIVASGMTGWLLKPAPVERVQALRQFVLTPAPAPLAIANSNRDVAITPDGTRVIYLAGQGPERTLYVWPLDALSPTALRKAERFFEPFVSPDSNWVAFIDETDFTLRKIPLSGGPPVSIAEIGRDITGATWGPDGTIVFAFSGSEVGLWRLPAGGGSPTALTTPDKARGEFGHFWPEFLPGGQALIYTVRVGSRGDHSQLWALDLRNNVPKKLVESGTGARYSDTGHLVYGTENGLWAVRFDPTTLQVRGEPVQLRDAVFAKPSGAVDVAVSADGSLVYVSAASGVIRRRLVWIDRSTGTRQPANLPPRAYNVARISPDGSRVALDIREEENDIWIWDVTRNTSTRITSDPSTETAPIWTTDGSRIVFASARNGTPNLYAQSADGAGKTERLTESTTTQYPSAVSRDGSAIYWEIAPRTFLDVLMVPLAGPVRRPTPLLQTTAAERNPELSPDGKWLVYASNENQSAEQEIYVRPFPNVGASRVQISSSGGAYPAWHPRAGSELFYVRPDGRLVSVPMRDGVPSGTARVVVDGGFYIAPNPRTYDISPDGKRFLMIENLGTSESAPSGMIVVLNWTDELRRRLPTRR